MSGSNPLSSRPHERPQPGHPAMLHAKAWGHVSKMPKDDIPSKIEQMDAVLPMLGMLAGNPNVKSKDVIRAAADAAAKGKATPSEAVSFISQMPTDPGKLQPWLRSLYEINLSTLVHMKAALLQPAQAQPQPQQPPQGQPPQGMPNG